MDDAIREDRCARVAAAVKELIPAIFEGKADPERLQAAMAPVHAIRDVAAAGSEGISDPAYAAWVRVGPANLGRLEDAVRAGDADAAFAALRDPEDGLSLLTQGCAGCTGW